MWIVVILVIVVVVIIAKSRPSKHSSTQDLDSAKVRNMIDSTGAILTAATNLQGAYSQLRPFVVKLDRMHEVLCSYPRAEFTDDMTMAVQAVVTTGESALDAMPIEAQAALADYLISCRDFLARHGAPTARSEGTPSGGSPTSSSAYPPDCRNSEFEREFLSLCQYLGSTPDVIRERLGEPDEDKTNEYGTRFLFYPHPQASFTVSKDSGKAIYVSSPVTAGGSAAESGGGLTEVCGIKVGDSRAEVRRLWGPASSEAMYVWLYSNRRGNTANGLHYELAVSFGGGAGPVDKFEGRLVGESDF